MDDPAPQRKLDPVAVAVLGVAALLAVGMVLYLVLSIRSEPAAPVGKGWIAELREKLQPKAKPAPAPKSAPQSVPPGLAAGHTWRYDVVVKPAQWRDIALVYRTRKESNGTGVLTDFTHAEGKMNFHLGVFAAGHPSHANTRFPGFFMYASYFPAALRQGQRFSWSWAWQPAREGRIKRYEAQVLRWEKVQVPAGTFEAALIVAELAYVEGGKVRARAQESLWYAPAVSQVVRIVREGRTPDEGSSRIVAELAEYR
ncbi:MAG: hypothetical protein ACT4P8_22365 [Betaproteobacteria bacterium]